MFRSGVAATLGALATAALLAMGCDRDPGRAARERAPRVVLVTFDTFHVDFAGSYNPEVAYTPNLDRFAERGTVFERAYTTVPITLPSHTSLMTGRNPARLAVMVNGDTVAEEVETLAELLADAGYRTGAFVSLGVLRRRFGLAQGFEHYDDDLHALRYRWYRTADEIVDLAEGWLSEVGAEPFFGWFHFSDPHEPYVVKDAPPDVRLDLDGIELGAWNLTSKERRRLEVAVPPGRHVLTWTSMRVPREDDYRSTAIHLRVTDPEALASWLPGEPTELAADRSLAEPYSLEIVNEGDEERTLEVAFEGRIHDPPPSEVWEQYALEVEFMDRQLGRLRELVEPQEGGPPTLWILVSDHGEGLYRRGILGHADAAHEDQLRIVWQLAGPGVPADLRISTPVLVEDVLPTVLDLLGLATPDAATGVSRTGCWEAGGCAPRDEWWSYGADAETGKITAVAGHRGDWKLLAEGKRSGCFDLSDDPWEERNLGRAFTRHPERMPEEVRALNQAMQRRWEAFQKRLDERSAAPMDAEQRELLESLGYLGN